MLCTLPFQVYSAFSLQYLKEGFKVDFYMLEVMPLCNSNL